MGERAGWQLSAICIGSADVRVTLTNLTGSARNLPPWDFEGDRSKELRSISVATTLMPTELIAIILSDTALEA